MEIEYVVMDGCGGLKLKDQVGSGREEGDEWEVYRERQVKLRTI